MKKIKARRLSYHVNNYGYLRQSCILRPATFNLVSIAIEEPLYCCDMFV